MEKRKLNEIEFLIWTFGQPNNMSMSITLRGQLDKNRLRNSLDKVQEKHPMLQAQLILEENKVPYFSWDRIRKIPLEIIPRSKDNLYEKIVEKEFVTPFETGIESKDPLIRCKLLFSEQRSDIIITLQHVIGDGLSMGFIFRDLLLFYIQPQKSVDRRNIMKTVENILPPSIQKKIPKTSRKFKIMMWGLKLILKYKRFKNRIFGRENAFSMKNFGDVQKSDFLTSSLVLTEKQTKNFIKKCKEHNITVHSAICTIFLEDFPSINNPVNLREKLPYPVKDSVGVFAGGLVISKKYNENVSFWKNAREYNKELKERLNSQEIFKIFKIISRAVSIEDIEEFGPAFIEVASDDKPFAVTNLGSLDRLNLITTSNDIFVEHLFGGVSSSFNAIILTVFTIQGRMHFHLHYYSPPYSKLKMEEYIVNAREKLKKVLDV